MHKPILPIPQDGATLQIEWVAPNEIRKNPNNSRTHSPKQIRTLRESFRSFGFNNPIIVDANGMIIAGHARYEAAISEGLARLPIVRCFHLTPTQLRAYALADNKIAEIAGGDRSILALELAELSGLMSAEGLEISLTGFDAIEINGLLTDREPEGDSGRNAVPAPPANPVTRAGDIWVLTKHRLGCADCPESGALTALMSAGRAAIITEPGDFDIAIKRWQLATKRCANSRGRRPDV